MWSDTGSNEPALGDKSLAWLNSVLDQENIHHFTYGASENKGSAEIRNHLEMLVRLGVRGVSTIFASGNDAIGEGDCRDNNGSGRVQFVPLFPESRESVSSGTIILLGTGEALWTFNSVFFISGTVDKKKKTRRATTGRESCHDTTTGFIMHNGAIPHTRRNPFST